MSDKSETETKLLPVDWSTEPTPAYVHGAHVAHTIRDFAVVFDEDAGFPGRNALPSQPDGHRGRIVASLRMTPDTFFQVLCALNSSWNRYSQQFMGQAPQRPRFKLLDAGEAQLDAVDEAPRTANAPPPSGK